MGELVASESRGLLAEKMIHLRGDERAFYSFFENCHSPLTRMEYVRAAREFFSLYRGDLKSPKDITRSHIIAYKKYLLDKRIKQTRENPAGKPLAAQTILKKLSAISSLCKHLAEDGLIAGNLTYGIGRPKKQNETDTAALSKEQVKALFAALDPHRYNFLFNRALLGIGFFGGLRIRELCHLRVKNLGQKKGIRCLQFIGKRDSKMLIPLHPAINLYLEEHLDDLKRRGFDIDDPNQCLFPNLRNPKQTEPITPYAVHYIFTTALAKSGIQKDDFERYSSHSMRATFATRLSELDTPIEDIQGLLGHLRVDTTQIYVKKKPSIEKSPAYKLDF